MQKPFVLKLLFVLHVVGGGRDHSSSQGSQCKNRQSLMVVISLVYSKTVIVPLVFHLQTKMSYFYFPFVRLTKHHGSLYLFQSELDLS